MLGFRDCSRQDRHHTKRVCHIYLSYRSQGSRATYSKNILPELCMRRQLVSYQKEYFGDDDMGHKKAWHFLPGVCNMALVLATFAILWVAVPNISCLSTAKKVIKNTWTIRGLLMQFLLFCQPWLFSGRTPGLVLPLPAPPPRTVCCCQRGAPSHCHSAGYRG